MPAKLDFPYLSPHLSEWNESKFLMFRTLLLCERRAESREQKAVSGGKLEIVKNISNFRNYF